MDTNALLGMSSHLLPSFFHGRSDLHSMINGTTILQLTHDIHLSILLL